MIKPIQYISFKSFEKHSLVDFANFKNMKSMGMYEINIIDFNDANFWQAKGDINSNIQKFEDLRHLKSMIANNRQTNVIIIYPRNLSYKYNPHQLGFHNEIQLKSNLSLIHQVLETFIICPKNSLYYELNEALIGSKMFYADFHFGNYTGYEVVKRSNLSEKLLAIKKGNIVYTTINFDEDIESILLFLEELNLVTLKEESPEWFLDFSALDDKILLLNKERLEREKSSLDLKIKDNNKLILNNNYFKSIVYTNGKELVQVVLNILEEMLGASLSSFKDTFGEDFNLIIDEVHFVGEIKGVNNNVNYEMLSQLDKHCSKYLDKKEDKKIKIKGLLIVNTFRKTTPKSREDVHNDQIDYAINKYDFLIIKTIRLLEFLTEFRAGKLTRESFIEIIKNNRGLL